MKHHKYSPSDLENIELCPGKPEMEKGMPEESNQYSEEGKLLHEKVVSGDHSELNSEQIIVLEKCNDFFSATVSDLGKINYEEHVQIFDDSFKLLTEGTADIIAIDEKRKPGIIIDWKFGRGEVTEAANNLQLATYALGAAQKYGLEEVTAHIFQPRVFPNNSYYSFRNFGVIQKRIEKIIARSEQPGLILCAGKKQCKNCRAKIKCPEYARNFRNTLAVSETAISFSDLPDQLLSNYYAGVEKIEAFMKAVKAEMHLRLSKQEKVGSYTLGKSSKVAKLNNPEGIYEKLNLILTPNEFISATAIMKGKLETLFIDRLQEKEKMKGNKVTKKALKEEFKQLMQEFTTYTEKRGSIEKIKED